MFSFSKIDRHAGLMSKMADRNGADLEDAIQSGVLSPEHYRTAVLSCTACIDPDACEARLATGEGGVPEYCRNAGMISRIAGAT